MKLNFSNSKARGHFGIVLIECLVYLFVFVILLGVGFASFYLLWDNSTALRFTSDDIGNALRAGEMWRADVRAATGKIQIEKSADGVVLKIPRGTGEIDYRFSDSSVCRKNAGSNSWTPVLSRVKTSQMEMENRNQISAWHWELELIPPRARAKVPLLFSFETVAPHQP